MTRQAVASFPTWRLDFSGPAGARVLVIREGDTTVATFAPAANPRDAAQVAQRAALAAAASRMASAAQRAALALDRIALSVRHADAQELQILAAELRASLPHITP